MKISTGFNPERKELVLIFQTNLLEKYYPNLKGLISKKTDLPKNISIRRADKTTAEIIFPLPEDLNVDNVSGGIAIDGRHTEIMNLHDLINSFMNSALKKEYKTTEFIPLRGYPQEDIITDTKVAVENKRNLMLIKDYDEYLKPTKDKTVPPVYNQYLLEYGSSEWADVVIEIQSPDFNIKDLEKRYSHKLKETSWL